MAILFVGALAFFATGFIVPGMICAILCFLSLFSEC